MVSRKTSARWYNSKRPSRTKINWSSMVRGRPQKLLGGRLPNYYQLAIVSMRFIRVNLNILENWLVSSLCRSLCSRWFPYDESTWSGNLLRWDSLDQLVTELWVPKRQPNSIWGRWNSFGQIFLSSSGIEKPLQETRVISISILYTAKCDYGSR